MNKYHNKETILDGIKFQSKREATRYAELKLLQRAGKISDLRLQVPFELLPTQRRNGKVVERPATYIADFVYCDKSGELVVEDAKGHRTKEYVLKRKMVLWFHGIQIKEV